MNLFFSFKGRATRLQYWVGNLFLFVLMGMALIGWASALRLSGDTLSSETALSGALAAQPGMLIGLVAILLAAQVCATAIVVKRYHDRDKSGWWYLVLFVPFIGPLWQVFECGFLAGTPGRNRFDRDLDFSFTPNAAWEVAGAQVPAGPPPHRLERAVAVSAAKQTHNARFGRRSYM